jgi:hypothetical protein
LTRSLESPLIGKQSRTSIDGRDVPDCRSLRVNTFEELVASRRAWLDDVLQPWCRVASRVELLKAHQEWVDVAGKVDPNATLWTWAWSRFPALVHEELPGVDETRPVRVTLASGEAIVGFPDGRQSELGRLVVLTDDGDAGPFSIDDVVAVETIALDV